MLIASGGRKGSSAVRMAADFPALSFAQYANHDVPQLYFAASTQAGCSQKHAAERAIGIR